MEKEILMLRERLKKAGADQAALMYFVGILYQAAIKDHPELLDLIKSVASGNAPNPFAIDGAELKLSDAQKAELEKGIQQVKQSTVEIAQNWVMTFGRTVN